MRTLIFFVFIFYHLQPTTSLTSNETSSNFTFWIRDQPSLDFTIHFSYDGSKNNLVFPQVGLKNSDIVHFTKVNYADGISKPNVIGLPNPLALSDTLMHQSNVKLSKKGLNVFAVYFGQQVFNEIVRQKEVACPTEFVNIDIPEEHYFQQTTGRRQILFRRLHYNPTSGRSTENVRRQTNQATPWIDAETVYSNSKVRRNFLIDFQTGKFKTTKENFPLLNNFEIYMDNYPSPVDQNPNIKPLYRQFVTADPLSNETPFLFAISTVWMRWHNHLIDTLSERHLHWSGLRKFHEARKWVVATQQHIITNEWLPSILDQPLAPYDGYKPMLNPQITKLFASLATKYLLTLTPSLVRIKALFNCQKQFSSSVELRLCNSFFSTDQVLFTKSTDFFNQLIVSMLNHAAEREDHLIVDDLRRFFYGELDFTRRDGFADALQSAREQGVPDYLSVREALNLTVYDTFDQLHRHLWPSLDQSKVEHLKRLYSNDVWRVDALVGCYLELSSGPSQIIFKLLLEQFQRIRSADRFWFENTHNNLFTQDEIVEIKKLTFRHVISSVTKIPESRIQPNVFKLPDNQDNRLSVRHECLGEDQELAYRCYGNTLNSSSVRTCYAVRPLNLSDIDSCTPPRTFDYFEGSQNWYVGTFTVLTLIVSSFWPVSYALIQFRKRKVRQINLKRQSQFRVADIDHHSCLVMEWIGEKDEERPVELRFDLNRRRICLLSLFDRRCLRQINMKGVRAILYQCNGYGNQHFCILKMMQEYDLALRFDSLEERNQFCVRLERFLSSIGVGSERIDTELKKMLKNIYTKSKRQEQVEVFFHAVFSHTFGMQSEHQVSNLRRAKSILNTELTQFEFAEALSIRPESQFVQQMFALIDKDKNGYLSFREFLDMMIIFANGTADQKAKLMFDMYDLDGNGSLSKEDFQLMIGSMLELANQNVSNLELQQLVLSMLRTAGLEHRKQLDLKDFLNVLGDFKEEFNYMELNFEIGNSEHWTQNRSRLNRQSALFRANETFASKSKNQLPVNRGQSNDSSFIKLKSKDSNQITQSTILIRFLTEKRWHIFWILVFYLLLIDLFLCKAYYYTFEQNHNGIWNICGFSLPVSRASAYTLMFCFALLLLTMCRNLITFFRETFVHRFVPFDSAVVFHKHVAICVFLLSIVHSIAHAINFYSISTQSPTSLRCAFPSVFIASDSLPKFQDWFFFTLTGLSGALLLLIVCLMVAFASAYSRRHAYQAFWATHSFYPLIYLLIIVHGLGKLIQPPAFLYFMAIPLPLFALDRLISLSRKKIVVHAASAQLYPSDVVYLALKRPTNFTYKSGQWARIACLKLNHSEYHPFTLASAPHEDYVQFYIRAIGPFTKNLQQLVTNLKPNDPLPPFYLDGPYGEGHQDWSKYEVSILIGGGIGVTPFASILKDIAFRSKQLSQITCRRVFFLWITRTQKHFEWLVDIIKQVEQVNQNEMVSTHIFITQFQQKFDLRTLMLYVCERHFQKVSGRSLFTGLQAKTHFGRPDFEFFFASLQSAFADVSRMGVFSCGPATMTSNVQTACEQMNRKQGPLFIHHYDNF